MSETEKKDYLVALRKAVAIDYKAPNCRGTSKA